ncbi:MAG: c-type cytochrome [Verrucomicrobiota bacterium]
MKSILGGLSCVVFLTLVGCGKPEEVSIPPGNEAKAEHPWEWIPDEPDLAAGREIYLSECAMCHNEGEEGAPVLGLAEDWNARVARGEAALIRNAIDGFIGSDGEMPARGGSDFLTDGQVSQAVRFMIAINK